MPGSSGKGRKSTLFRLTKQIELIKLVLFRFKGAGLKAGAFEHHNRCRLLALPDTALTEFADFFCIFLTHRSQILCSAQSTAAISATQEV